MIRDFLMLYASACGILTFGFLALGIRWLSGLFAKTSSEQRWLDLALLCSYALFPLQGFAALGAAFGQGELVVISAIVQLVGFLAAGGAWFDVRRADGTRPSLTPFIPASLPILLLIVIIVGASRGQI